MATRCVNIDWLEMYCLEPSEPRGLDYFAEQGLEVKARDYGTKHWSQVFTICDDAGNEFMEVRRAPRTGAREHHTIYPDNACNLRLVNRYCYYDTAAWIMSDFIEKHGYKIRRIFRLDLCIDFKVFDTGDKPASVARRIARHVYTKIYQSERTIHGRDYWDHCDDNSFSWGKKGSMVVTRFYNKSLELATVKDKPWIRQAWYESGLIDDPIAPIVLNERGEVVGDAVWRLEFQINSSARGWFVCEADHRDEYVEHTLECYWNRPMLQRAIACLQAHYFNFRIFKQGVSKYDCPEKKLFKWADDDVHYKLRNSLVRRTYDNTGSMALRWCNRLRALYPNDEVRRAIDVIEQRVRQSVAREIDFEGDDPKVLLFRAIAPEVTRSMSDAAVLDLFADVF